MPIKLDKPRDPPKGSRIPPTRPELARATAEDRAPLWGNGRATRHVSPTVCRGNNPPDYEVRETGVDSEGKPTYAIAATGGGGGLTSRTYAATAVTGATYDADGVLHQSYAVGETKANDAAFAPRSGRTSKGGRKPPTPNALRDDMLSDAKRLRDAARNAPTAEHAKRLRDEARTLEACAPAERPEPDGPKGYGASWPTARPGRDTYTHHGHEVCPTCGTVCGAIRRPGPNGGLGPCSVRGKDRGKGDPNAPTMPYKATRLAEQAPRPKHDHKHAADAFAAFMLHGR